MASLTIRKLDDRVKEALRVRAARNGRSMEEEARELIEAAVGNPAPSDDVRASAFRKLEALRQRTDVSLVDDLIAERRREASRE